MRLVRYVDFGVQTLIIAGLGIGYFLAEGEQVITLVLLAQVGMGIVQLLSSGISVLAGGEYQKQKKLHLIAATVYLLLLGSAVFARDLMNARLFIMLPPWLLASYYYYLTWLTAFRHYEKGGKFLPHTSF